LLVRDEFDIESSSSLALQSVLPVQ